MESSATAWVAGSSALPACEVKLSPTTASLMNLHSALTADAGASFPACTFDRQQRVRTHSRSLVVRKWVKRAIDIVGAAALLLCLSPLLALCAVLVRLSSGPLLYCHNRVGKNGQPFTMWKYRTMYTDGASILARHLASNQQARDEWNQNFKLRRDPRVTPAGRFLRRFSLDELPQLWNVIRGDMSLIGPRPIVNDEIGRFGASFHAYCAVRPGMTGLWQVSGRSSTTYEERVRMDEEYVQSWSMTRDLIILCQTVRAVVKADGAW